MRILLISGEYPSEPESGGIGSYTAYAARALADAGHDVHVLCCRRNASARDLDEDGFAVHVRPLPVPLRAARGRVARRLAFGIAYRRLARALGAFDVVEAPDWHAQGIGFAVARRVPLVVCLHTPERIVNRYDGGQPRVGLNDWLERWTVQRAAGVTTLSQLLVSELRADGWLSPTQPVGVVAPPVHLAAWDHAAPIESTAPLVLGVGRLEPRKGFDVLLRAVALLTRTVPDIQLVLAGAGTSRGAASTGALAELALSLGVDLTLTGPVSHPDLAAWFARARVVAVPSRFEGFSISGMEALAAARPVVCTRRVGLAELADGTAAIAVADTAPVALAGQLEPYLVDTAYARAAGQAARDLAIAATRAFSSARVAQFEAVIARRVSATD